MDDKISIIKGNKTRKEFPEGHTAEVTSLLDHLRKTCVGHGALMRALERPATRKDLADPSSVADWLMEALWLEGFKIVPLSGATGDDEDE